jgi:hypothetical protein
MATMGVHILLLLPNCTATTAEMDQLYSKFKPRCSNSTIRVAGIKMAARVAARKKAKEARKAANQACIDVETPINVNDEDSAEESSKSDDDGIQAGKQKRTRTACNVSIGNRDLASIVNGYPGNPIARQPLDYTFTRRNIINSWIAVNFLPMTANVVNDPKVRFELGEGGAPEAEQKRIIDLYDDYKATRQRLDHLEFNVELFNIEPVLESYQMGTYVRTHYHKFPLSRVSLPARTAYQVTTESQYQFLRYLASSDQQ